MPYSTSHPDFTLVVDGHVDGQQRWVITARLHLREGLGAEDLARLYPVWSSLVRQGVALERSRGRAEGASRFVVRIEAASPARVRRRRARPENAAPAG